MPKSLLLDIVTPDRLVLSRDVESVTGTGVAGAFTILPLHIPFFTALAVGYLSCRLAGETRTVFVAGGFADVAFDKVLVLAEAAELPEEIDVDRAKKARERAEARLAAQRQEEIDYVRAKAALQRAILRLRLRELAASGLAHRSAGRA